MKLLHLPIALTLGLASLPIQSARAAGPATSTKVCTDAYAQAQSLRDAHKLRAARDSMHVCAAPACKDFIVKDCTAWLLEIEGRMPSVVLVAKDARGQSVVDAAVTMDGAPLAAKLDGVAVEVDPGPHTFTFKTADGTTIDQAFTVLEGQKAQTVSVVLGTASGPAPAAEPAGKSEGFWTTRREVGIVVGGVGVVGLVVGGILGGLASSAASQQKTDCASAAAGDCTNHSAALSDHSTAATDAAVSNVGLIAGGALLATGAVLVLLPSGHSEGSTSGLTVAPMMGRTGTGLALAGRF